MPTASSQYVGVSRYTENKNALYSFEASFSVPNALKTNATIFAERCGFLFSEKEQSHEPQKYPNRSRIKLYRSGIDSENDAGRLYVLLRLLIAGKCSNKKDGTSEILEEYKNNNRESIRQEFYKILERVNKNISKASIAADNLEIAPLLNDDDVRALNAYLYPNDNLLFQSLANFLNEVPASKSEDKEEDIDPLPVDYKRKSPPPTPTTKKPQRRKCKIS